VIAQKVVSKAEGRIINYSEISPSHRALELAGITGKDARLIEMILSESNKVIRAKMNTIIVEHKLGFICANAGIDHSNISDGQELDEEWILLLPKNPDESARNIKEKLETLTKKKLGVLIIDSHGRAWRSGTVGITIGLSGVPGLIDQRGHKDMAGYVLKATIVGAADELAAGASLLMGQADEATPVIHVRGFPYELGESKLSDILRPENEDLFR
jgi:coenzyme F420-0:L-glutamate ligase/coenzyme F420-1:gamma-L-glutamate ligase